MANTILPKFNHILKQSPLIRYPSPSHPLSITSIKTSYSFPLLSFSSFKSSSSSMSSSDSNPNPTSNGESPIKTVRVVVKGRVQGVFYRNWTIENAKELGLKGWVRNRRDGSVEALFSGDPNSVSNMEERCRSGPRDALVTSLQAFPSTDEPGNSFVRYPTL